MRISRSEATERCEKMDDSCYPPVAYKGSRFTPIGAIYETYTELEAELLKALVEVKENAGLGRVASRGVHRVKDYRIDATVLEIVKVAIDRATGGKEVCDNDDE